MGRGDGAWREGRRAWDRLAGWYGRGGRAPAPLDAELDPLVALNDVGMVRRLLDGVELEAVRSARQQGRSWAEIATRLGVTRQSAWERWRELDVGTSGREPLDGPVVVTGGTARAEIVAVPGLPRNDAARSSRRRAWVVVPDVVGMTFADARRRLAGSGLVGLAVDADDLPLEMLDWGDAVVTDQSPEAGAKVEQGALVHLWTSGGGGSGVREPRRPRPTPRAARKVLDEPSEEAVS